MDIAEIRKKAKNSKADGKSPAASPDVANQGEIREEQSEIVAEPVGRSEDQQPGHTGQETGTEDVITGGNSGGLDKLFAVNDTLELATEESYQDVISSSGEHKAVETCQYLAFNLGQEEYALDINRISEIIKVREFTDIPRVPDFILGIISLRGVVVPVFDLMRRFRLGETNLSSSSRIIVCQEGELQAGLMVDSINQVINLVDDNIEPPPAILSGLDRDLVKGVGRFQGRMIILLHLASVLDVEQSRD